MGRAVIKWHLLFKDKSVVNLICLGGRYKLCFGDSSVSKTQFHRFSLGEIIKLLGYSY